MREVLWGGDCATTLLLVGKIHRHGFGGGARSLFWLSFEVSEIGCDGDFYIVIDSAAGDHTASQR